MHARNLCLQICCGQEKHFTRPGLMSHFHDFGVATCSPSPLPAAPRLTLPLLDMVARTPSTSRRPFPLAPHSVKERLDAVAAAIPPSLSFHSFADEAPFPK